MAESKFNFENDFVCKILDVNKNTGEFILKCGSYLSSNNGNLQKKKVSRILDLLRFSDAVLTDQGVVNDSGLHLLHSISELSLDSDNLRKAQTMSVEVGLIEEFKKCLFAVNDAPMTKSRAYALLSNLENQIYLQNEHFLVQLHSRSKQQDWAELSKLFDAVYESVSTHASALIKYLLQDGPLDVDSLLSLTSKKINDSKLLDEYTLPLINDVVADWKYLGASIYRKSETNEIIIQSNTDPGFAYAINRLIDQSSRDALLVRSNAFKKSNKPLSIKDQRYWLAITTIYGINELMKNPDLENVVNLLLSGLRYNQCYALLKSNLSWLTETIQDVPVYRWVDFLINLKVNIGGAPLREDDRTYTGFVKYDFDMNYFTQEELDIFFNALCVSVKHGGDLLDAPIVSIIDKSSVLLFAPAIRCFDPTFVLRQIMMRDDQWQNKTGHAFELAAKSWLSANKYDVQDMDVKSDKGGKNELDAVIPGRDGNPLLLELKTFIPPHSQRDYRFQVDKLCSSQYIEHAKKNMEFFAGGKGDLRLKNRYNWTEARQLFVSNLLFEKQQYNDIHFGFAQQYQLYRLINQNGTDTLQSQVSQGENLPLYKNIESVRDFDGGITSNNVDKIKNDKYFRRIFSAPMGSYKEVNTSGSVGSIFQKSNDYLTLTKMVGNGWVRVSYA